MTPMSGWYALDQPPLAPAWHQSSPHAGTTSAWVPRHPHGDRSPTPLLPPRPDALALTASPCHHPTVNMSDMRRESPTLLAPSAPGERDLRCQRRTSPA